MTPKELIEMAIACPGIESVDKDVHLTLRTIFYNQACMDRHDPADVEEVRISMMIEFPAFGFRRRRKVVRYFQTLCDQESRQSINWSPNLESGPVNLYGSIYPGKRKKSYLVIFTFRAPRNFPRQMSTLHSDPECSKVRVYDGAEIKNFLESQTRPQNLEEPLSVA